MSGGPGWALAVWSWGAAVMLVCLRPRRQPRLRRSRTRAAARGAWFQGASGLRLARPAALLAGSALAVAFHPVTGLVFGVLAWWLLPAVAARLDTNSEVARRAELAVQLPLVAGLLSSCLAAGAPLVAALAVTADAVPEPAHTPLRRGAQTVALGGGPAELGGVFAATGEVGWQSLAAAVMRSSRTGAPLADLLHEAAAQAQGSWAAAAAVRARSVAVRTVLPLALCYLPAFLLLGVAPLVAGLLGDVTLP